MATCRSELLAREAQPSRQGKLLTDLILELVDGELEIRSDRRTRRLAARSAKLSWSASAQRAVAWFLGH